MDIALGRGGKTGNKKSFKNIYDQTEMAWAWIKALEYRAEEMN